MNIWYLDGISRGHSKKLHMKTLMKEAKILSYSYINKSVEYITDKSCGAINRHGVKKV